MVLSRTGSGSLVTAVPSGVPRTELEELYKRDCSLFYVQSVPYSLPNRLIKVKTGGRARIMRLSVHGAIFIIYINVCIMLMYDLNG